MDKKARVVKKIDGKVILNVMKNSDCDGCAVGCGGCGNAKQIEVKSNLDFCTGEIVGLKSNGALVMLGAFTTYIFPLLFMIFSYFVLTRFMEDDNQAALISIFMLILGFIPAFILNFLQKKHNIFKTTIKKLD